MLPPRDPSKVAEMTPPSHRFWTHSAPIPWASAPLTACQDPAQSAVQVSISSRKPSWTTLPTAPADGASSAALPAHVTTIVTIMQRWYPPAQLTIPASLWVEPIIILVLQMRKLSHEDRSGEPLTPFPIPLWWGYPNFGGLLLTTSPYAKAPGTQPGHHQCLWASPHPFNSPQTHTWGEGGSPRAEAVLSYNNPSSNPR